MQHVINEIHQNELEIKLEKNKNYESGKYYIITKVNGNNITIQKFTQKKIHNFNGDKPLKLVLNNEKIINSNEIEIRTKENTINEFQKGDILRKLLLTTENFKYVKDIILSRLGRKIYNNI